MNRTNLTKTKAAQGEQQMNQQPDPRLQESAEAALAATSQGT
jgi:hypothetical protein